MSKNPQNVSLIRQTVRISQMIEGYKPADGKTLQKAKELKRRYALKVSIRD